MTINCLRDFSEDYVVFSFSNDKFFKDVTDIINEITFTLQEIPYKRIIIDFSETNNPLFFLDWVKVGKFTFKEFKTKRIALVDSRKEIEQKNTIETILFNSGVIFRTFTSLSEAKNWVIS